MKILRTHFISRLNENTILLGIFFLFSFSRAVILLCGVLLIGAPIIWPLMIVSLQDDSPGNVSR